VARHISQVCPVWVYTKSNITDILFLLNSIEGLRFIGTKYCTCITKS
jgi:hypothetical protein